MKKKCSHVQGQLSAFLDGKLDAEIEATVTVHLERCASCRQALSNLEKLVRAIGEIPQTKAPADFSQRLFARIEDETKVQRFLRKLFLPLRVKLPLELATAAVVVLTIFLVAQQPGFRGKTADQSINLAEDREMPAVTRAPPAPPTALEEAARQAADMSTGVVEKKARRQAAATPPTPRPNVKEKSAPPPKSELSPSQDLDIAASEIMGDAPEAASFKKQKIAVPPPSSLPAREPRGELPAESLSRSSWKGSVSKTIELTLGIRDGARAQRAAEPPFSAMDKGAAPTVAALKSKERSVRQPGVGAMQATESLEEDESAESRVRDLATRLGGTVSRLEKSGTTHHPVTLNIDIPTAHYALFCTRLQSIGTLENPPPDVDAELSPTVKIRLTLRAP